MLTGRRRPRPPLKCTLFEPNTEKGGGACWTGAQQTKRWPGQVRESNRCTLAAARSGHSQVHTETLQPRSEVRLHAIKGEQPNMALSPCNGRFILCQRQSGTHTCVLRSSDRLCHTCSSPAARKKSEQQTLSSDQTGQTTTAASSQRRRRLV